MQRDVVRWAVGSEVPHIAVRTVDGGCVEYRTLWQRRNVVIAVVGDYEPARLAAWCASLGDLTDFDGVLLMAREVPGLNKPSVVVADRWGEIFCMLEADADRALPPPGEVREWLGYVQRQCPECRAESR